MRKGLVGFAVGIVLLAAILVGRAVTSGSSSPPRPAPVPPARIDVDAIATRLAAAIAVPTVSFDESGPDATALAGLHERLAVDFPGVFLRLTRETLAGGTLILEWPGRDTTLAPIVLMAHQDVVPVPDETLAEWQVPPFEGRIAGGFVWGRGAVDDKASLVTILSAVEALLADGFEPGRTILLVFGHDEEVGGRGAAAAARRLEERGVRPALVLDEGMAITRGVVPGVDGPVALVGVAEKGYATFELSVEAEGGHSSMPPPQTAIGIVATAVARATRGPLPARPNGPAYAMLEALAPSLPFASRVVVANRWLLGPLLERQLASSPSGNAMLRTTLAPTVISGGVKENVLPSSARAVLNSRIAPGDSVTGVEAEIRRRIADSRVAIRRVGAEASEPSPVSDAAGWGYRVVAKSVLEVEPDTVVAPGLMIGATDARRFTGISDQVLRFQPVLLDAGDLARFHGKNERISIENLERAARVYVRLIENAAG